MALTRIPIAGSHTVVAGEDGAIYDLTAAATLDVPLVATSGIAEGHLFTVSARAGAGTLNFNGATVGGPVFVRQGDVATFVYLGGDVWEVGGPEPWPRAVENIDTATYTFVAGDAHKLKVATVENVATVDANVHAATDRLTILCDHVDGLTVQAGAGMVFDPVGSAVAELGQTIEIVFDGASSARVFAPVLPATSAEAVAGTETQARLWSPYRVREAVNVAIGIPPPMARNELTLPSLWSSSLNPQTRSTGASPQNAWDLHPFHVDKPGVLDAVEVNVVTSSAGSIARLAVYSLTDADVLRLRAGLAPTGAALVSDLGTVSGAATGWQQKLSIGQPLTVRWYAFGFFGGPDVSVRWGRTNGNPDWSPFGYSTGVGAFCSFGGNGADYSGTLPADVNGIVWGRRHQGQQIATPNLRIL